MRESRGEEEEAADRLSMGCSCQGGESAPDWWRFLILICHLFSLGVASPPPHENNGHFARCPRLMLKV